MADETSSTIVHTYHCLCSTLILATTHVLDSFPRREDPVQDTALILAPPVDVSRSSAIEPDSTQTSNSSLLNVVKDRKSIIIRREDGFEKRTLFSCTRCRVVIGYSLDDAHWENEERQSRPVYLLPGGLVGTEDMVKGKQPDSPAWAEQK